MGGWGCQLGWRTETKSPTEDADLEGLRDIQVECPADRWMFRSENKIWLALVCRWQLKPHENDDPQQVREASSRPRRGPWDTWACTARQRIPGRRQKGEVGEAGECRERA